VDKIRTSDVSGQMHYLSNWYKQFQSENDTSTKKSDFEEKVPSKSNISPGTGAVKRTSSGRIVRQRVDLAMYNNVDEEEAREKKDKNVKDNEKQKDSPQKGSETNPSPTPRPTSLNPFRIPVHLLNFKQTQTTLVARQAK
jgi:hypothetical protein